MSRDVRRNEALRIAMGMTAPRRLVNLVALVLGSHPSNSLVVIPEGSGRPIARVDLPARGRERVEVIAVIADVYRRYPVSRVALLAYTHDHAAAHTIMTDLRTELSYVNTGGIGTGGIGTGGIGTVAALIIDGARWYNTEDHTCGTVRIATLPTTAPSAKTKVRGVNLNQI